jgi:RNA polymerase sigma-70 factor, ECF subfamily
MCSWANYPQPERPNASQGDVNQFVSDSELINQVLAGSADLFPILIGRHQQMVRALLRMKLRDESKVDDVFQTAVLKCFANLGQFRFASGFGAWFANIALNEMRQGFRRDEVRERYHLAWSFEAARQEPAEPIETVLVEQQHVAVVRQIVQALPLRYRDAMVLRYIQGLSFKEVSQHLNLSGPAVKSRLFRGLRITAKRVRETLNRNS